MPKLEAGHTLEHRKLTDIHGHGVQVPDPHRMVHLQFRRYAGCPICHRHLRTFALRHHEILEAGINEVVVFHSTATTMLEFQGSLPFAAIADPDRRLYADFGVESSARSVLHPGAWTAAAHGTLLQRSLRGVRGKGEAHLGLPADFLIDVDGRILVCGYGVHANDQWPVDRLLELASTHRP